MERKKAYGDSRLIRTNLALFRPVLCGNQQAHVFYFLTKLCPTNRGNGSPAADKELAKSLPNGIPRRAVGIHSPPFFCRFSYKQRTKPIPKEVQLFCGRGSFSPKGTKLHLSSQNQPVFFWVIFSFTTFFFS